MLRKRPIASTNANANASGNRRWRRKTNDNPEQAVAAEEADADNSSSNEGDEENVTPDKADLEKIDIVLSALREQLVENAIRRKKTRELPGGTEIDASRIDDLQAEFEADEEKVRVQQAVADLPLSFLAERRSYVQSIDYTFSNEVTPTVEPSDQKRTGRCWMFAGLNMFRRLIIRKLRLPKDFEFSQSYLFFFDKLERSNYLLELMISLAGKDLNDQLVYSLMGPYHPISDGGSWPSFKNLVMKYGVVPKDVFNECHNTSSSGGMNKILKKKLASFILELRKLHSKGKSVEQLRKVKDEQMIPVIHEILTKFMGHPPSEFTWRYKDKHGDQHVLEGQTPVGFFEKYIDAEFNIEDKLLLVHDPRDKRDEYKTYIALYGGNMVNGENYAMVNCPIKVIEDSVKASIIDNEPCWFGCDVSAYYLSSRSINDEEAFDYDAALGVTLRNTKVERINGRTSYPSHAMTICGVDIGHDSRGREKINKWRVENSWGEHGASKMSGYIQMSASWFREYMFLVAVDKQYIPEKALEKIEKHSGKPVYKDFYDPFGSAGLQSH